MATQRNLFSPRGSSINRRATHPLLKLIRCLIAIAGITIAAAPTPLHAQQISKLDPAAKPSGSPDTDVTVTGSGFTANTAVWINCSSKVTVHYKSAASIVITLPAAVLTQPQLLIVTTAQQPCTIQPGGTNVFVVSGDSNGIRQTTSFGQSLVGVDFFAASSTNPQAVFLGSASLDLPMQSRTDIENVHWWLGGGLRIAGMTQPGSIANLSSQAAFSGFLASATGTNATPDKVVQSVEAWADVGYKIAGGWRLHTGTFDSGTKPPNPVTLLTISAIVRGGAITPLSASQANPPVYEATTQIQKAFPGALFPASCAVAPGGTPSCFVAFIPVDRSHFYRHYEAGFRLKIYGEDNADHELRFPGIIELTVGQNEFVTAGQFRGSVLHVGGTLPVPALDGFYGFGSMDLALSNKNNDGAQLLLIPAPSSSNLTFTSPSVIAISVQQPNRDRYLFGVGIDLVHLIASKVSAK